ncbi:MAG: DNA methyltransferase, partial [Nitrososphaerota archaeon]
MRDDLNKLIQKYAEKLWEQIQKLVPAKPNEVEFRQHIEYLLSEFCKQAGLTPWVRVEYTLATGRADTVFNRLIIEYKRPGTLSHKLSHSTTLHAVEQVKKYILDLAKQQHHELTRIAGVVLDGEYIIFVRYYNGNFAVEDPVPITLNALERLLTWLVSLTSGIALTAENLNRDFSIEQSRVQNILRALTQGLNISLNISSQMVRNLFEQWKLFFSEVIDYSEAFGGRKLETLNKWVRKAHLEIHSPEEAKRFFFVLHTYFALLVKLIAWLTLSRHFAAKLGVPSFGELVTADSETLQRRLTEMESGGIFRTFGITNLLEGDFFAWYLYAWNEYIESAIRDLFRRLDEYEPTTLSLIPEESRDLFKKLYQYLLPREIRHNLGEYYTPDWLAQRLLNQIDHEFFTSDPYHCENQLRRKLINLRWLDPACGSGTFLVLIITRMRELGHKLMINETELLNTILHNVVGFDLNPLAVTVARVNYLLAIADLLPYHKSDITIPVYLADSVRTPALGKTLFTGGTYEFPTAVGKFLVPAILCTKERFDRFCDLLEESIRSELSPDSFLKRIETTLRLKPNEWKNNDVQIVRKLYEQILKLHKEGMNGLWARLLKNNFA